MERKNRKLEIFGITQIWVHARCIKHKPKNRLGWMGTDGWMDGWNDGWMHKSVTPNKNERGEKLATQTNLVCVQKGTVKCVGDPLTLLFFLLAK